MKKFTGIVITIAIMAALACTGMLIYRSYAPQKSQIIFKTSVIERKNIMRSISATGTVEPQELVNVGAQVNGKIMSFGKDEDGNTVDYGSKVKANSVMATIDDVTYKAELQGLQASREQAEASIQSAEASIKEAEANEILAKNNFKRAETLIAQKSMTQSDYDSYYAANLQAQAQTAKAKAALAQAKASLSSVNAELVKAERNLEYCTITSPVDGIVIDRRVSIGQTVVSNQTASSIFLVAKDFSKMQVWSSVNEADIGSIKKDMDVEFSCDAFPNERFRGKVFRVRLNATLSSNVVTYIVEINCGNADGKLIPYLTANVKFIRDERKNVLSIPNSVLRYSPPRELMAAEPPQSAANQAVLWKDNGQGKLIPILVNTGINNGLNVEIITDELNENDKIVTGSEVVAVSDPQDNAELKNPFMPNMPKPPSHGSAGKKERAAEREKTDAKTE